MTVIAVKDSIVAGDTLECSSTGLILGHGKKVFKHANGWVSGAAGYASDCVPFQTWVGKGARGSFSVKDDDFNGLYVTGKGDIIAYYGNGLWDRVGAPFYAIGAGREIAIGAMANGACAVEAVSLAIKFSVWCGGEVSWEKIG